MDNNLAASMDLHWADLSVDQSDCVMENLLARRSATTKVVPMELKMAPRKVPRLADYLVLLMALHLDGWSAGQKEFQKVPQMALKKEHLKVVLKVSKMGKLKAG